jgi:hypothetical protein
MVTPIKTGIAGGVTGGAIGAAIGGMGEEDNMVRDAIIGAASLGSLGALTGHLVQTRLGSVLRPFKWAERFGLV